jgi:hypothetical protein
MRRDLQTSGFGDDQSVFVGLSGGEGAGRIQLNQLIFEHAFNIYCRVPTLTGGYGAPQPTDNTMSIRTTRPPLTAVGRSNG